MNAKLRKIDATAEVLARKLAAGRITEGEYLARLRVLTDRAEEVMGGSR